MRKYMNSTLFRQAHFKMFPQRMLDADDGSSGSDAVGGSSGATDSDGGDGDDDAESIQSLKAELAKAKSEAQRFKNSLDKVTKEKGELSKKNRDMMSAEQLAKEAEEERNKRFAEMEKELRQNKYSKRLVGIGMSEKEADEFAMTLPEFEDADGFFNSLDAFIKAREKAAGDKAIQELLKNRPDIHAGNGDQGKDDDPAMAFAKKSIEVSKNRSGLANTDIINRFL